MKKYEEAMEAPVKNEVAIVYDYDSPGIVPYPAPEHSARSGGTVIVTYRHAMKDADNNVPFGETLPVHYNALAGLTVEETEIRAYGKLSAEELNSYLEMTRKLTAALREETEKL